MSSTGDRWSRTWGESHGTQECEGRPGNALGKPFRKWFCSRHRTGTRKATDAGVHSPAVSGAACASTGEAQAGSSGTTWPRASRLICACPRASYCCVCCCRDARALVAPRFNQQLQQKRQVAKVALKAHVGPLSAGGRSLSRGKRFLNLRSSCSASRRLLGTSRRWRLSAQLRICGLLRNSLLRHVSLSEQERCRLSSLVCNEAHCVLNERSIGSAAGLPCGPVLAWRVSALGALK